MCQQTAALRNQLIENNMRNASLDRRVQSVPGRRDGLVTLMALVLRPPSMLLHSVAQQM
jgi:hypothetical protein